MTAKEPLVSIFIPVYNGEKYLVETLNSIQEQTYKNIEILLVDDSSTDSSLFILKKFESNDNRFKVFVKENGGMVPKSMNFVMPYIKGEFFFYASQDDIFSEDLIEKMIKRQIETNADTVLPDMEFYFQGKSNNKTIIGLNGNRNAILSGKEALIESLNWNIHGFALFKSSLVKSEKFPEDAFDSDEYMTRKFFSLSNRVVFSEGTFFYRQDNVDAITKVFSVKNFYTLNTDIKLYKLLKLNKVSKKYLIDTQIKLLEKYFSFLKENKSFRFENFDENCKINKFLLDFKKNNFNDSFLFENLKYTLLKFKLKFFLMLLLCKM